MGIGRKRLPAVFAGMLAFASMSTTTVLVAHADTVACYYPAEVWEVDGNSFQDGYTPVAEASVNECVGGPQGGPYDGNTWDQYWYHAGVSNGNEQDVWQEDRAWVCGNLAMDTTTDSQTDNYYTSPWWNYQGNNNNQCDIQFDQMVRITAWSGERFSEYTSDQSGWGTCNWDSTSRCPTGG